MKIQNTIIVAIAGAVLMATGCSKKEETTSTAIPETKDAASSEESTLNRTVDTASGQIEAVKQKAEETVTQVKAQTDAAVSKVQGIIDNAKKLIGESKWSDALTVLNSLSGQQLTPDQQTIVQGLKDQVQKAVQAEATSKATDEAGKAVGGLLGK